MKNITSISSFSEYLDLLALMKDSIIIFSIKDTAGYWLNDTIQLKLKKLGLKENLIQQFFVGYIAILKDGKVLYEKKSKNGEYEEYHTSILNHAIDVISRPYENGNKASICIDKKEYAVNERGLNIVIYSKLQNKVIDSVAFDTHVPEYYCTRIKEHYDVGVVGCWWGSNYGSCLNGYAVYKTLKSFGLSVWMINRHDLGARRDTQNYRFAKKFYPCDEVSPIIPMDKMNEINEKCDIFLAGSDQIWKYFLNRLFDMEYMLKFAGDSKKKISFGSSFGHSWDTTPKELLPQAKRLMKRFNAVSVREESGVDICRDTYGIKATTVIEPVFCLEQNQYRELANFSNIEEKEPFILTYILDPSPEKRRAIQYYSKISGMKTINVLDLDHLVYEKNRKILDLPNIMPQIAPQDFIKLYMECSFVLTDSFHGTSFAIIFNKPFLSITNYNRGAVRFNELLEKFDLMDRLVTDPKNIPESQKYFEQIDYSEINQKISDERKKSISWLKKAIETPIEELPSIMIPQKAVTSILDKKFCMGCGACVSICPKNALSLVPDEYGYYKSKIDYEKCVDCGICSKVCSAIELPKNTSFKEPKCFEFIAADDSLLEKSSSGGIFPVLANIILEHSGNVVGAAWEKDFSVKHIIVNDKKDLPKLQKSKYLQSYLGKIYKDIKLKLENNEIVLFSGCPCQVAGLKAYLGKEYENLVSIDLLCGNSPSPKFFKKYVEEAFPKGIVNYEFRDKKQGWRADTIRVIQSDGNIITRRGGSEDNYQRVYHNHTMCSTHCEKCKYQTLPRFGDITIGDFWGIGEKDTQIDTQKGVSVILCNSKKGEKLISKIPEKMIHVMKEVPLNWLGGNGYAINGSHNYCSPHRNSFYDVIRTMPFSKAVDYALKPNKGIYNDVYKISNSPLQFDSSLQRFKFDTRVWEEHTINGLTTLIVKPGMSKVGRYAVMSMGKALEQNKKYLFSISFKMKTSSHVLNLHIKDSGSNYYQVVYSYNIPDDYSEEMIKLSFEFSPKSNIFDEFMIGASQISGQNNYIAFDYINITEVE